MSRARVAIIGAGGSIGSAVAKLLAEEVGGLMLVGNPKSPKNTEIRMRWLMSQILHRLNEKITHLNEAGAMAGALLLRLAKEEDLDQLITKLMQENGLQSDISWTLNCNEACSKADIIVTATSSVEAFLDPYCFKPGAIICDVSRPANVSEEITRLRPDVLVVDGGVVQVPGLPDLGWNFGFGRGLAYACMCETMMLGLEKRYEPISLGADLHDSSLDLFRALAQKHGFKIAELRQFGRTIAPDAWERWAHARHKNLSKPSGIAVSMS